MLLTPVRVEPRGHLVELAAELADPHHRTVRLAQPVPDALEQLELRA